MNNQISLPPFFLLIIAVFQVPCQKKTGSVGRIYIFFFFFTFLLTGQNSSFPSSPPKKYRQCHQAVDPGDMYYGRCCCSKFVPRDLCTLALQTLDCCVLSGNNNHNTFILFQGQRRPEYIKCKVTLLYYYHYYIEIKASSCFHSVFLKSHYLYNYFNIQYLIKVLAMPPSTKSCPRRINIPRLGCPFWGYRKRSLDH